MRTGKSLFTFVLMILLCGCPAMMERPDYSIQEFKERYAREIEHLPSGEIELVQRRALGGGRIIAVLPAAQTTAEAFDLDNTFIQDTGRGKGTRVLKKILSDLFLNLDTPARAIIPPEDEYEMYRASGEGYTRTLFVLRDYRRVLLVVTEQ